MVSDVPHRHGKVNRPCQYGRSHARDSAHNVGMNELSRLADGLPGHFIREWRNFRGLSQEKVEELTGIDRSYLGRIERGRRRYNEAILEKLAKAYQCTPNDLINVPPVSFAGKRPPVKKPTQYRLYPPRVMTLENYLLNEDGSLAHPRDEQKTIAFDYEWLESIIGVFPDNIDALKVEDASMSPTLERGDWVIVNLYERQVSSGGVFVIQTDQTVSIRRLQPGADPNSIVISVDQPNSRSFELPKEKVRIFGRVVLRSGPIQ